MFNFSSTPPFYKNKCSRCEACDKFDRRPFCVLCGAFISTGHSHCQECHESELCSKCGEFCEGNCGLPLPPDLKDYEISVDLADFFSVEEMVELCDRTGLETIVSEYTFRYSDMLSDAPCVSDWAKMHPYVKMSCVLRYFDPAHINYFPALSKRIKDQLCRSKAIVPQIALFTEQLSRLYNTAAEYMSQISTASTACVNIFKVLSITMTKLVTDPVKFLSAGICELLIESVHSLYDVGTVKYREAVAVIDEWKEVLVSHVKFIVRAMMGYSLRFVALEYFFDSSLFTVLSKVPEMFTTFNNWVKGQSSGFTSVFTFVLAGFFVLAKKITGISISNFSDFNTVFATAKHMVPSNIDEMVSKLPYLSTFFSFNYMDEMAEKYPATVKFMNYKERFSSGNLPSTWEIRVMRKLYAQHLQEKKIMPQEIIRYYIGRTELWSKPDWLFEQLPRQRRQPKVIFLEGRPGQGKTETMHIILEALYNYCRTTKVLLEGQLVPLIPEGMTYEDFWFDVAGHTKHMDGFRGQPVMVFNDFLAEKEVPGDSLAAKFLGIVDTSPYAAPMAELSKKGQYVEPMFVIVTTNAPWENWSTLLSASNNSPAYVRRVTRYYKVVAREVDDDGVIVVDPSRGADQAIFYLHKHKCSKPIAQHDIYDLMSFAFSSCKQFVEESTNLSRMTPDVTDFIKKVKSETDIPKEVDKIIEAVRTYTGDTAEIEHIEDVEQEQNFGPEYDLRYDDSEAKDIFEDFQDAIYMDDIKPEFDINDYSPIQFHASLFGVYDYKISVNQLFSKENNYWWSKDDLNMLKQHISALPIHSMTLMVDLATSDLPQAKHKKALYDYIDWNSFQNYDGDYTAAFMPSPVAAKIMLRKSGLAGTFNSEYIEEAKNSAIIFPILPILGVIVAFAGICAVASQRKTPEEEEKARSKWKLQEDGSYKLMVADSTVVIEVGKEKFKKTYIAHAGENYPVFLPLDVRPESVDLGALVKKQREFADPDEYIDKFSLGEPDAREMQQIPVLRHSIFKISLDLGSSPLSHAFALSCQEIVIPVHVCVLIDKTFSLRRGDEAWVITKFSKFLDKSRDLALLVIHNWRLPRCRNHFSKLLATSDCFENEGLVKRLADNSEEDSGVVVAGSEKQEYYDKAYHLVRRAAIPGSNGFCGRPFIWSSTSSPSRLLGIHVAGSESTTAPASFFSLLTQQWVLMARNQAGFLNPLESPPSLEEPIHGQKFRDLGFQVEGKASQVVRVPRVSAFAKIRDMYKVKSKNWTVDYDIARLTPVIRDGEKISPEWVRFAKWSKSWQPNKVVKDFSEDVIDCAVKSFQHMTTRKNLYTFDECIQSHVEDNWASMSRGKSAGPVFPGLPKWVVCDVTAPEPKLTSEATRVLVNMENRFATGTSIPFLKGLCLKDEKLLVSKVEKSETRLFAPEDVWCYILCKKYFSVILIALAKHGSSVGIMANQTPESMGKIFEMKSKNSRVVSSDVKSQDTSHTFQHWIAFFKFFLKLGWFDNAGPGLKVHPDLPPLNRTNRIRFFLIREMAMGLFVFYESIISAPGMLGSGCLLTFIFNCMINYFIYYAVMEKCYTRTKVSDRSFEEYTLHVTRNFQVAIFGDDTNWFLGSLVTTCPDLTLIISEVALEHGYQLTNPEKGLQLYSVPAYKSEFCGRQLVHHAVLGPVMALQFPRMLKSVQFVKRNAVFSNYPGQVMGFLREAVFHGKDVFDEFLEGLAWNNGIALSSFGINYKRILDIVKGDSAESYCRNDICEWVLAQSKEVIVPQMDRGAVPEQSESALLGESAETGPTDEGTMAHLVEDAAPTEAETVDSDMYNQASMLPDHVEHIWTRPKKIGEFTWTTLDEQGDDIYQDAYPSSYFKNNPNAQMKLANVAGMKVNIRIKVVLNSIPQQQGILALYGSPMARVPQSHYEVISGPHALISAGSHTSAELTIPYCRDSLFSRPRYFDAPGSDFYFDFVSIGVNVISILRSPTSSVASLVFFAWLEVCETIQGGLTDFTISPQRNRKKNKESTSNPNRISDDKVKVVDEATKNQDSIVTKIVTGLKTVAGIAVAVGEVVSVAAPLLAMMGLSKPLPANNVAPVVPRYGNFMPNFDAIDYSVSHSIYSQQKQVAPENLYGNVDPMLTHEVTSRVGLVATFEYTVGAVEEDLLFTALVDPGLHLPPDLIFETQPTPLTAVASLFKYWRGTICYRLRIAKTAFHSGTLEILIDYGNIIPPNTEFRSNVLHRVVWDISLMESIVIEVPYIYHTHFRTIYFPVVGEAPPDIGPMMYIKALTPLIAAATVEPSVEILVEHWSPDCQFGWPLLNRSNEFGIATASKKQPTPKKTVSTKISLSKKGKGKQQKKENIKPQMLNFRSDEKSGSGPYDPSIDHALSTHVLLGPYKTQGIKDIMANRFLGGELILDLRQVTRRFMPAGLATIADPGILTEVFDPRDLNNWPAWYRALAQLFVFGFGGWRLKLARADSNTVLTNVSAQFAPFDVFETYGEPVMFFAPTNEPVCEVHFPNVAEYFQYVLGDAMTNMRCYTSGSQGTYLVTFAGADDFSMGGINYLPKMVINRSSPSTDDPTQLPLP